MSCILHNLYTNEKFKRLFRRNRDFQLKPIVLRDTHKLATKRLSKSHRMGQLYNLENLNTTYVEISLF